MRSTAEATLSVLTILALIAVLAAGQGAPLTYGYPFSLRASPMSNCVRLTNVTKAPISCQPNNTDLTTWTITGYTVTNGNQMLAPTTSAILNPVRWRFAPLLLLAQECYRFPRPQHRALQWQPIPLDFAREGQWRIRQRTLLGGHRPDLQFAREHLLRTHRRRHLHQLQRVRPEPCFQLHPYFRITIE
jgi:hypothetical protein